MGNCFKTSTQDDISLLRGLDSGAELSGELSSLDPPPPYHQHEQVTQWNANTHLLATQCFSSLHCSSLYHCLINCWPLNRPLVMILRSSQNCRWLCVLLVEIMEKRGWAITRNVIIAFGCIAKQNRKVFCSPNEGKRELSNTGLHDELPLFTRVSHCEMSLKYGL